MVSDTISGLIFRLFYSQEEPPQQVRSIAILTLLVEWVVSPTSISKRRSALHLEAEPEREDIAGP